ARHFFDEWGGGRVADQEMNEAFADADGQTNLAAQVLVRHATDQLDIDLANVRLKQRQAEFFAERFDEVALLDDAHFDQHFAEPFAFRAALALHLARRHNVLMRDQPPRHEDVADAQAAAVAANEIIQAGFADPVHF